MKHLVTVKTSIEIEAKNAKEAHEVTTSILHDRIKNMDNPEEQFEFSIKSLEPYSDTDDPIVLNDRKAAKAKAFIADIIKVCKEHNMLILPTEHMWVHSMEKEPYTEKDGEDPLHVMEEELLTRINLNYIQL